MNENLNELINSITHGNTDVLEQILHSNNDEEISYAVDFVRIYHNYEDREKFFLTIASALPKLRGLTRYYAMRTLIQLDPKMSSTLILTLANADDEFALLFIGKLLYHGVANDALVVSLLDKSKKKDKIIEGIVKYCPQPPDRVIYKIVELACSNEQNVRYRVAEFMHTFKIYDHYEIPELLDDENEKIRIIAVDTIKRSANEEGVMLLYQRFSVENNIDVKKKIVEALLYFAQRGNVLARKTLEKIANNPHEHHDIIDIAYQVFNIPEIV